MANRIKTVGGSLALQITQPARTAGLVEERSEDDVRLADVKVASVDDTLIVSSEPEHEPAPSPRLRVIDYPFA